MRSTLPTRPNIADFDFERNIIRINKNRPTMTRKLTTPKTETSNREIEMPPSIMERVKDYVNCLDEVTSPLFNLNVSVLRQALLRGARKAGLKPIRLHDLRHSHASYLIAHGVPITAISRRLGHKTPTMTLNIYSHFYKESGAQIAALLQETLI